MAAPQNQQSYDVMETEQLKVIHFLFEEKISAGFGWNLPTLGKIFLQCNFLWRFREDEGNN